MDEHNPNFVRAWMLMQQARYDHAERELRLALVNEPNSGWPHSLLAICLMHLKRFQEANDEAEAGISLDPENSFAHYARSVVLAQANCFPEAEQSIRQAIALDPYAPHSFAQLALIRFQLGNWKDALDAADQGLQLEPDHDGCLNMRTMALVKLGDRDLATAAIQSALERDPDDPWTHTNMGWTLLEKGQPEKAMEHFKEALRLQPELEYAREGIVTAMKARYILYRPVLGYLLWVQKFSRRYMWAIFIGAFFLIRFLNDLGRRNPTLQPWTTIVIVLYFVFALTTWLADPLFNLVLRLNRFGRLALTDDERKTSTLVGICVLAAVISVGLALLMSEFLLFFAALAWMMVVLPLSLVFKAQEGLPRISVLAMAILMALMGAIPLAFLSLNEILPKWAATLLGLMALACLKGLPYAAILTQIGAQWVVARRPRMVTFRRM